jgi:Domain of unknown function (DUF3859)
MLRLLPLCLFVLVLTAAPDARAQQIDRVEIVEWGLFQHDLTGVEAAPLAATGTTNLVANVRLREATTTVPALVEMKFGFRYKVVGSPSGTLLRLKVVTRLPSPGATNPNKGKTFSSSEFQTTAVIGTTSFVGYGFDYDWEVVPGPWTLELWHEGRKLAEKTFIVTRLVSSAE